MLQKMAGSQIQLILQRKACRKWDLDIERPLVSPGSIITSCCGVLSPYSRKFLRSYLFIHRYSLFMYSFKGKVAVVTGGARDIGRQVSLKLATAGAKVCINYFGKEPQFITIVNGGY